MHPVAAQRNALSGNATMTSQIRPLEDLTSYGIAYWLPPGGRDNGVWADIWVAIADLETAEAGEVLACWRTPTSAAMSPFLAG